MAYHFVKLTQLGGKSVYINGDNIAAVHEDMSQPNNPDTLVIMTGSDASYYRVRESVEKVTDILFDMMND